MTTHFARDFPDFRFRYWALPVRDVDCNAVVAWFHPRWWTIAFWRVVGPVFALLVRSGLWRIEEGGYYTHGRLQWPDMWSRTR